MTKHTTTLKGLMSNCLALDIIAVVTSTIGHRPAVLIKMLSKS